MWRIGFLRQKKLLKLERDNGFFYFLIYVMHSECEISIATYFKERDIYHIQELTKP